jgi:hypothetical protein
LRSLEQLLSHRGRELDSNQVSPPTTEPHSTRPSPPLLGSKFDLLSGREIKLDSLEQYRYGSERTLNLSGKDLRTPDQLIRDDLQWIDQHLLALIDRYEGEPFPGDPYIIPPLDMTGSKLPVIRCVAQFTSAAIDRGEGYDYSGLIVIWFQVDFAFPIDSKVLAHIVSLDWERYAAGMNY